MPQGRVLIHLPRHLIEPAEMPPIYHELRRGFGARGAQIEVLHRDLAALQNLSAGPDFHIVHNGGASGDCVLNTIVAYLLPYFYFDPKGLYFQSASYDALFDPADVDAKAAERRFEALRQRYVVPRVSRYPQSESREVFAQGAIAIFLQDWSDPVERARFISTQAMVETVVKGAAGRPVIVKPHPRNHGPETVELLQWLRQTHPWVQISGGNLHDMLAACAVCVSICSSVAIEAMLHRKPVILFGKSDLHHCATTVRNAADWPAALQAALTTDWPYETFVHWFFDRQIRGGEVMFAPLLQRMQAAGADFAALGLSPPSLLARQ